MGSVRSMSEGRLSEGRLYEKTGVKQNINIYKM
jgi:hypothetical protein